MNSADTSLKELNRWMLAHHMHGYWMHESGTQHKPYLWKWADIYAGLLKAGELVPVGPSGMTEMRTIGLGRTEVAGERLEWAQGDIFCVPPWMWHRHENPVSEDAILYSVDDWPALAKMGFYRWEDEGDAPR